MDTKPLRFPLFGSWSGLETGFMTWFRDAAMINPHVADLWIFRDRVEARYAAVPITIATLDLKGSFIARFSRHDYGNGTSEVNAWLQHPHHDLPRIGFKTLWPTKGARADLAHSFEYLPFMNPFEVTHALQTLRELSGVWGVGWNPFYTSRPDPAQLRALRSESRPIPCPGCWQQRIAHPEQSGPMSCPLDAH